MSNYNTLKTAINANIRQNGVQAITGQVLNSVLNQMVTSLGVGYQYAGVLVPTSPAVVTDSRVFYFAFESGIYTNFGGIVLDDEVAIIYYDTAYHKQTLDLSTRAFVTSKADAALASSKLYTDASVAALREFVLNNLDIIVNGYYATMRVGLADNLAPKGEVTEETIPETRQSGGSASILDGDAIIKKLKGNSLVWNQALSTELSVGQTHNITQTLVAEYLGNLKFHITGTLNVNTIRLDMVAICGTSPSFNKTPKGHKWMVKGTYNNQGNCYVAMLVDTSAEFYDGYTIPTNAPYIFSAKRNGADVGIYAPYLYKNGDAYIDVYYDAQLVDLTQVFGAGNEPSTYEDYLARKPKIADEYAYDEGTIIHNATTAILTKNEDESEESTRSIPIITEKFADGFKSAGTAHDEIEIFADKTIVRKRMVPVDLGSLAWGTGWWSGDGRLFAELPTKIPGNTNIIYPLGPTVRNDNLLINNIGICGNSVNSYIYIGDAKTHASAQDFIQSLSGVVAFFELAEPIVEELPPINAEYKVWGNGTENNVAERDTTPLIADVVYGLDAYTTIKMNKSNIGNLASLTTASKTDLVAAINELAARLASIENNS